MTFRPMIQPFYHPTINLAQFPSAKYITVSPKIWSEHHPLIRQLYWRDFFYHVAWYYPHVFGHAFHERFDGLMENESFLIAGAMDNRISYR